jgi:hypothetical protein
MNDTSQNQQSAQQLQTRIQSSITGASSDDTDNKLDTFESVLDEIKVSVPHGVVQAVDQATDTLNPQQTVGRSAKERIEVSSTLDSASIDSGSGVQSIEHERIPEIPVEVESYLQRVEDHHQTAPTEVVIADGTNEVAKNKYPSKPVIVLPITQAEEKEGMKKSTRLSYRWLVEFSHKVVKMFTGKVIYKQEEN